MDLFEKDSRPSPNYTLIKNAFEYIDIRKDGLIDMNEWLKAFTFTEVKIKII
jgi:Ca2+-binding EF-hand superfamily protein